jgi:hypothetical protein
LDRIRVDMGRRYKRVNGFGMVGEREVERGRKEIR